jgi:hypothetical protein
MIAKVRYCVSNVKHARAAEYALRSLLEMVISPDYLILGSAANGRDDDEVLVTYGIPSKSIDSGVHVFESGFFDDHYGTIEAMPQRPVVRIENIPALYRDDRGAADTFCSVCGSGQSVLVECHVDIAAGTFFMLSRYEETVVRSVDRFARFPAESSIAYQEGFLQEPVVNQYAEQLLRMLRIAGFTGERRRWWGPAPWAIALTHDIDELHRFPMNVLDTARYVAGRVPLGTPRLGALLHDFVQTTTHRKADEYNCLQEMAAWEVSTGLSASYYFLGENSGWHGADYCMDEPGVVSDVQALAAMGHEVGFHAGISTYEDMSKFESELSSVESLGIPVAGGRQHYLRWKTPLTWRLWEQAGLGYDATLGYSKVAGFRCGSCLPFKPYDIEMDREMSLWEWPLMFMDATYRLSWGEGTVVLQHLVQQCSQYGGVLVLLWHSANWSDLYASPLRHHFQELIVGAMTQGTVVSSIVGLTQLSGIARSGQVCRGVG